MFFSMPFKTQVVLAQKTLHSLILKDTDWNAVCFMTQLKALIWFLKSYMKKSETTGLTSCTIFNKRNINTYANFY